MQALTAPPGSIFKPLDCAAQMYSSKIRCTPELRRHLQCSLMCLAHSAGGQVPHGLVEASAQLLGQQQVPQAVQQPRKGPAGQFQNRHAQRVYLAQLRDQVDDGGCTCNRI